MALAMNNKKSSPGPHNAQQYLEDEKDIATTIVGEHRQHIDPAVEARVVRKIDRFLIPAMIVGYGLVYYDKVSPFLSSHFYI